MRDLSSTEYRVARQEDRQNFKRDSEKNRTNANADKMAAIAKLTRKEEDGAHACWVLFKRSSLEKKKSTLIKKRIENHLVIHFVNFVTASNVPRNLLPPKVYWHQRFRWAFKSVRVCFLNTILLAVYFFWGGGGCKKNNSKSLTLEIFSARFCGWRICDRLIW